VLPPRQRAALIWRDVLRSSAHEVADNLAMPSFSIREPMNANDNPAENSLRRWWLSPPLRGIHRLINPWVYRYLAPHLREREPVRRLAMS